MIKKGIDLMQPSPHKWLSRRVPLRDSVMACDVCTRLNRGRKRMCIFCKFRSATLVEFLCRRKKSKEK